MFPTLTEKLDPEIYMGSMAELVKLSGVAMVLTSTEFKPALRPSLPCPVYSSTELAAARPPGSPPDQQALCHQYPSSSQRAAVGRRPSAVDIAFLQHSSGTTGLQKGVALSHTAVLNQVAAYSDAIQLHENDVVVSWLPLYHDMGLIAGFLMPLIQGAPLVLMSPFDWVQHPALLLQAIHDHHGTLCWLPNFAYNHCARRIRRRDSEELSLASMRLFVNCSEPVRHDSHQMFLERFAENGLRPEMLGVSYAMAENTFAVTQTPAGRPATVDLIDGEALEKNGYAKTTTSDAPAAQPRVSCGPPIANTEVKVVDDQSRPLAERYVGEIAIRSDCLLTGYYRRPDLRPFDDEGWYLTGDMGYIAGGELYVAGRRKDLIINAGKNIYPADIEAVVNEIPGIHAGRAVAFGVPDEREGTELIAVVAEVKTTNEEERRVIGRAIRQEVARRTMVTVSYVHLVGPKWLLKTSSGKIARGANREKWLRERGPTAG
jgi:acyl-CoA synthetase (AMP-forming)/AMP-acid ligase II